MGWHSNCSQACSYTVIIQPILVLATYTTPMPIHVISLGSVKTSFNFVFAILGVGCVLGCSHAEAEMASFTLKMAHTNDFDLK